MTTTELEVAVPSGNKAKRILVVLYSQTGQLARVTERILTPLQSDPQIDVQIEWIKPRKPFSFPWSPWAFVDAFPECALMKPGELETPALSGDEHFDLVILPYQVWFLAPSQPIVAFLRLPVARKLLAGKPVITVIACRNMWMMAQEKMKGLLADCGARLLDNVAMTDDAPELATLVTTPAWVLTGKRDLLPGLPAAGITEHDIAHAQRFGLALRDALHADLERGTAPLLHGLAAASVRPALLNSEKTITRSFFVWGTILHAAGAPRSLRRVPLLILYALFLICAVFTIVPLSLLLQALLKPFLKQRLTDLKLKFEQPSGSGTERMSHYDF